MFSTSGLFRNVTCPNGDRCRLPNCIFSHKLPTRITEQLNAPVPRAQRDVDAEGDALTRNGYPKRRKLDNGMKAVPPADEQPRPTNTEQKPFVGVLTSKKWDVSERPPSTSHDPVRAVTNKAQSTAGNVAIRSASKPTEANKHRAGDVAVRPLQTVSRPVSPPPRGSLNKQKVAQSTNGRKPEPQETLNPRLLAQSPAGHDVRTVYLKTLHEGMVRLNGEVAKQSDPSTRALHLTDGELIKAALDEEEKIAREQTAVYGNVIKLRIVAYKKMKVEDWAKLRTQVQAENQARDSKTQASPPLVETGLSPADEVMMLQRFVADQSGLASYGYVTSPPTESDINSAREGVDSSGGWEVCDRCKSRFQVFPSRREDGALTTGGVCTYHWGRPYTPKYDRTDATQGRKGASYTCCNEPVGAPGCTTAPTHVFKISEAKRLALVLPFESTPPNPNVRNDGAVTFDCEMGYTTYGLELIRLTAASWPDGKPLIDVLVKPLGQILDLNSRFSGIFPEYFTNALEYDDKASSLPTPVTNSDGNNAQPKIQQLRKVSSPAAARSLLLSYISTSTPLMGHALENDLNAVRLVHPSIVDTVLLFPHPRGLPLRYGLKMLVKQHLQRDIQTAGAAGHDSLEDARATGDLIHWKVAREWKKLKQEGWTVRDGVFYPPLAPDASKSVNGTTKPGELPPYGGNQGLPGSRGRRKKRRIGQVDGAEETEDES